MHASGCIPSPTSQLTGTWPPSVQGHSHPLILVQSLSSTAFPAWLPTPQATALPRWASAHLHLQPVKAPEGMMGPVGTTHLLLGCLCSHQHWVSVMLLQHTPMTAFQRAFCPCCSHGTSLVTATPVTVTHPHSILFLLSDLHYFLTQISHQFPSCKAFDTGNSTPSAKFYSCHSQISSI